MKKRLLILLGFYICTTSARSQEVQWASEVVDYSSEARDMYYSPKYRAVQIVGKPNIFPDGTSTPCAWSPSGSNIGSDWITVGFVNPMKIKQIAISENVNPGSISQIYGIDANGRETLLYENREPMPKEAGRIWNVFIKETDFAVAKLKLVVDHSRRNGSKQIDAVAISDSEEAVEVKLPTVDWGNQEVFLENISSAINSPYGEVSPILSPDGRELYFTRVNHPDNLHEKDAEVIKQDIWYATKGMGKSWSEPKNIGPPLNNNDDNAVTCISADGRSLFILNIYNADGSTKVGLSRSRKEGSGWSFPEPIIIEDFQALSHDEVHNGKTVAVMHSEYSITPDEKVIVMGLKRSQTYGERDLYVSFRKEDGTYSKPRSLGPVVNTADIEGSPFIAADTKTLFFMSKGLLGYGNGDIFVSRRLDDTWTKWSEPVNLGEPINTPEWNGYINIPAASSYALVSSKLNKRESHDIYRVTLPVALQPEPLAVVSGRVLDVTTRRPINAQVSLVSVDKEQPVALVGDFSPETGEYKFVVPIGKDYVIKSVKSGYIGVADSVLLQNEKSYREIHLDLQLMPIKAGQKMVLNNLFFDQGDYTIKTESIEELERIIALMKEYPTMEVRLEGHTDNQGDLLKNVELAQKRVEGVMDYLVTVGGIDPERISVKSWGPTRPVSNNVTEENRKKNRRVEFTILKL